MPNAKSGAAEIAVFNILGAKVYAKNAVVAAGENELQINISDLPDGVYILKVIAGGESYVAKLLKE